MSEALRIHRRTWMFARWGGFGIEVLSVDLATATSETQGKIIDLFHHYGAVVVRCQSMSPDQQLAFIRRLGEPESNQRTSFTVQGRKEIFPIFNKMEHGEPISNWEAAQGWHTEASYQ
jgi:hypothetical protein